jgi:hypothetical protein
LDGMDKAIVLLQDGHGSISTSISTHVRHLQEVMLQRFETVDQKFDTRDERFSGIQTQFNERDVRTEQSSTATKIAIDAALQAQKEMVAAQNTNIAQALARIEATGQKQIEQLVTLLQTSVQATESKISDLKDRLALIEGRSAGIGSSWGVIAAVVGMAIAATAVIYAMLKP